MSARPALPGQPGNDVSTSCFVPDARKHKPQPGPWRWIADDRWTRSLECRFCGRPVQQQGLLRRWRHVT